MEDLLLEPFEPLTIEIWENTLLHLSSNENAGGGIMTFRFQSKF